MLGQSEIRKWLIRLRQIVVIARNEFLGPTVERIKKRSAPRRSRDVSRGSGEVANFAQPDLGTAPTGAHLRVGP
jgi:hypothetical protein